jgi:FkbM family methyltransferase
MNKPYFIFQPAQILRRLGIVAASRDVGPGIVEVALPWGLLLRLREQHKTALELLRRGVFDLTVSETLFRLADPGELAVDVGANVGYMTSVLAARLGPGGEVMAFEPHPRIHADLRANVDRWARLPDAPRFTLYEVALASEPGRALLTMGADFDSHGGSATLAAQREGEPGSSEVQVSVRRLDDVLGERRVGVLKADVEGLEIEVFKGAQEALRERRIRDIVFEDFDDPFTATAEHLASWGYTVFALDHGLLGPVVESGTRRAARRSGEDPSYLATSDPGRALDRLRARGWQTLACGSSGRTTAP